MPVLRRADTLSKPFLVATRVKQEDCEAPTDCTRLSAMALADGCLKLTLAALPMLNVFQLIMALLVA